ncbi:MAG: serine/threonine-protein kinase [Acidobacteriota bacterium]
MSEDSLDPEAWRELEQHYHRMLDLPAAEQAGYAADLEAERPDLAARLVSLVAASDRSEERILSVLERNLETLAEVGEELGAQIPERIGPYQILRELGRGGMSVVYLARRADRHFRKQVAIKVVLRGMDFDEILQRLRQERQILAQLEHPNISRLLDGGNTEDGAPYVVMEYVDGEPIDAYCRERGLDLRSRLELFCQVCEAVAHAHRNLVVHRDLKPSNVLVTAEGQVKLLDFGIAKLLDPDLALEFGKTSESLRLWTPGFASPEQIAGRALSTASDLYSLGVLLFELLVERSPYSPGLGRLELEKAAARGELARPSQAAADPRTARKLRGDLDAIVAEATRLRPEERYASAQNLAADVRRYLEGLPVLARRESVLYQLGKFARRHRRGLIGSGLGALLLLSTLVVSALRLAEERRVALVEGEKAARVAAFMVGLFEQADPARSRSPELTARDLLDQGALRVTFELAGQPVVRADLMDVMGTVYQGLGDYPAARLWLERARDLRALHLPANHPDQVDSAEHLASLEHAAGRYDAGQSGLEEVLERKREIYGPRSPEVATTLSRLGDLLFERGDPEAALRVFELAYEARQEHFEEPHLELAHSLQDLGATHYQLGDLEKAERLLARAETQRRGELGELHPKVAETLSSLGAVRFAQGEVADAERLLREALEIRTELYGRRHPLVALTLNNLGEVLRRSGQFSAALPLFAESSELVGELQGEKHPEYADSLVNYARTLQQAERLEEAEELYLRVLGILGALGEEGERKTPWVLINLGDARRALGRSDDALESYRRALELRRVHFPEGHVRLLRPLGRYGRALAPSDPAAAEAVLREALGIARRARPDRGDTQLLKVTLAELIARRDEPAARAEALGLAEEGLEGMLAEEGAETPGIRDARSLVDRLRLGSPAQ